MLPKSGLTTVWDPPHTGGWVPPVGLLGGGRFLDERKEYEHWMGIGQVNGMSIRCDSVTVIYSIYYEGMRQE